MTQAAPCVQALVPFAVASLEEFFKQAFKILIKYDAAAQIYMGGQSKKIDFEDAVLLAKGQRSLEEIAASWYTFQNMSGIQKAFSEWLGIDFRAVMRGSALPRDTTKTMDDTLVSIIDLRHAVVHRLELNPQFKRSDLLNVLADASGIIDVFVAHLEQRLGRPITDESWQAIEEE